MTSGFDRVPLADVLEFREGPGIMAADFVNEGVPLIRLSGLKDGAGLLNGCNYLSPDKVDVKWRQFRLREGDVLLSTSASLGEVAVVGTDAVRAIPYTGIISFRPKGDRIDRRLIRYLFKTKDFLDQIEAMGVGSVMRHFGPSHLRQMWVTVPPLTVQGGISDVLGALDEKIAANDRLSGLAENLAQSIFDQLTVHSARVAARARLAPILGGTPPRDRLDYWQGTTPWISARDVASASHGVVISTFEHISDEASRKTRAKALPAGSTVLTARGTVGAVVRLGVAASFNQSCYGFVPGDVPSSTLYFLVKSLVAEAREAAHGSVFDTITMRTFDHVQIPDLDKGSLATLEARLSPLTRVVEQAVTESETLTALRDALLPALMSGRLSVRDAEEMVSEVV